MIRPKACAVPSLLCVHRPAAAYYLVSFAMLCLLAGRERSRNSLWKEEGREGKGRTSDDPLTSEQMIPGGAECVKRNAPCFLCSLPCRAGLFT